ncbi:hypothetical protein ACFQ61_09385 [Streptomyces sp. NPDC056500]|uniref:hypothetical protein n=1 Tax=Streptomyces sp. NPDC056500 TaxID=3345840 RepID=UPI00367808A8
MSERQAPYEVTEDDLDSVASCLVEDASAAASAAKDTAAYDWWKVLFALYPNSKATHSRRPRDRAVLRDGIAELFLADGQGHATRPCTFCGTAAAAVWTKSNLPMFDTNKALNTLPPGVLGWPICRGCRIAAWALPYGSWVTAGSATVLSCGDEAAERVFCARNVLRARRLMHLGFESLPAGARPELVAIRALTAVRDGIPGASTLWSFKNDNQEPLLRVTRTRRAVPLLLATIQGNADLRRGWRLLELALTRRDKNGEVIANGPAEAARLLFEADDGRSRSFLYQLHYLLNEPDRNWNAQDRAAATRLACTYAEEILGMKPDLTPMATLIADWIEHGSGSPRGRLAEYRSVALSDYKLGILLTQAQFRLALDGRPVAAGPEDWRPLIQQRPRAWEQRMLLSATVMEVLQKRGVAVNEKPVDTDEQERTERLLEQPILQGFDDDDEMGPA